MVVFVCNQCGESLKKNQVEKHYSTKCRNCDMLSCVDCGKDFWGNDYEQHTKCISEEEKYSGKNFVPKANANKGEKKQEQWLNQVQEAINKNKNPRLNVLLEKLKDYPNIPRKRSKFENFVKNSLRFRDPKFIEQCWDLLMTNIPSQKTSSSAVESNSEGSTNSSTAVPDQEESQHEEEKGKLNKRERKEERQKNSHKEEKKEKNQPLTENGEENTLSKKKKKKNKKKKIDEDDNETPCKKAKTNGEVNGHSGGVSPAEEAEDDDVVSDEEDVKPKKTKFDWVQTITQVLNSKGEIPIKKLRKKVIAEYLAGGGKGKSEEKLLAKFNKKVTKNPTFVVHKERVKLRNRK